MKMRDPESVEAAESYLIEEAEALDAIREKVAPAVNAVADWADDPQAIARSLLSQLAVCRGTNMLAR